VDRSQAGSDRQKVPMTPGPSNEKFAPVGGPFAPVELITRAHEAVEQRQDYLLDRALLILGSGRLVGLGERA
jgi:hypothetical protein